MQAIQQSTKVEGHIQHLQEVHDDLDKEIQSQIQKYGDDALVQTLKKKKLHLKDEIEQFKKLLEADGR